MGFQSEKIYFHRRAREIGESRWTLSKKIKLVLDSMMSFSYTPVHFMSMTGFAFFILAFVWAVVLVAQTCIYGVDVEGWATIMVVMLLSFGLVMLMLCASWASMCTGPWTPPGTGRLSSLTRCGTAAGTCGRKRRKRCGRRKNREPDRSVFVEPD